MTVKGVFVRADETRAYAPGEVIFAEGDESPNMCGVVSGAVELRKDGEAFQDTACGDGPIDAAIQCIERITGVKGNGAETAFA